MLINYFVTLPLYSNMFGGTEALIGYVAGMTPGFLPEINSLWKIIIIGITPFNVVKGIIIAVVSYYVFKLVKKPLQF
jgi:riboflavin transporter FmnP